MKQEDSAKADKLQEEIGDLLFAVVNLARHAKVDAEQACRLATRKFRSRFERVESVMKSERRKFQECSIDELEEIWQRI